MSRSPLSSLRVHSCDSPNPVSIFFKISSLPGKWQAQYPMSSLNRQRPLSLSPCITSPWPAQLVPSFLQRTVYTNRMRPGTSRSGTGAPVLSGDDAGEMGSSWTPTLQAEEKAALGTRCSHLSNPACCLSWANI